MFLLITISCKIFVPQELLKNALLYGTEIVSYKSPQLSGLLPSGKNINNRMIPVALVIHTRFNWKT